MRHPKDIGDTSTLAIMLALQTQGYAVYVPFGENTRTDLIVDYGSRLSRVQCKTGRLRNGSVKFNTCSSYAHHPNPTVAGKEPSGQACPPSCRLRSSAHRSLLKNLAALLVRQDLPLHTLQRIVDRLRVAAELFRHLLVRRAFEIQPQRVRLER
jgi:hypothetical protein